MTLKTTTDCITHAKALLAQAELIKTKQDHIKVWDDKVDLLIKINDALATGGFASVAVEELREAKMILGMVEKKAGEKAQKTYARK